MAVILTALTIPKGGFLHPASFVIPLPGHNTKPTRTFSKGILEVDRLLGRLTKMLCIYAVLLISTNVTRSVFSTSQPYRRAAAELLENRPRLPRLIFEPD
jgi:hypothetical protein